MTYYTFQEVRTQREHYGKCPSCGKRTRRTMWFTQTVNPWNKNPDGTPRSLEEVRESVKAEANAWVPNFTHEKCAAVTS